MQLQYTQHDMPRMTQQAHLTGWCSCLTGCTQLDRPLFESSKTIHAFQLLRKFVPQLTLLRVRGGFMSAADAGVLLGAVGDCSLHTTLGLGCGWPHEVAGVC
jgi:hypothetical protein